MKKEIQLKSGRHCCQSKQPACTRSSSRKQNRCKPIRRISVQPSRRKNHSHVTSQNKKQPDHAITDQNHKQKSNFPSEINLQHYLEDIEKHMVQTDKSLLRTLEGSSDCFSKTTVTTDMRKILIKWLAKVASKFRCQSETLHLCVQLIDLMLIQQGPKFDKTNFQLLGVTCLLIASKYNEIYTMQARKYVGICDGIYTLEQLMEMESFILASIGFNLQLPTMSLFMDRLLSYCKIEKTYTDVILGMADILLFDFYSFNGLLKSDLCTAIVYLVSKVYKLEEVKNNVSCLKNRINSQTFRKCLLVATALFKKSSLPTPI